jgi:hypothetical protein
MVEVDMVGQLRATIRHDRDAAAAAVAGDTSPT